MKQFYSQLKSCIGSISTELQKLNDNNSPIHEDVIATSEVYSEFKSLSFTVYDGSATVTIDGVAVVFPLTGSNGTVLGSTFTADDISANSVTIDATSGKAYVTILN
jgi:hypothetical protein